MEDFIPKSNEETDRIFSSILSKHIRHALQISEAEAAAPLRKRALKSLFKKSKLKPKYKGKPSTSKGQNLGKSFKESEKPQLSEALQNQASQTLNQKTKLELSETPLSDSLESQLSN